MQLREIRATLEAAATAEANEAGAQSPGQVNTINILSLEPGQCVDPVSGKIAWHTTPFEPPAEPADPESAIKSPTESEFAPPELEPALESQKPRYTPLPPRPRREEDW